MSNPFLFSPSPPTPPSHASQQWFFKVGDQVKRGEEVGEVKAAVGSMLIVQVGNEQVAGPTIEWEIAAQAEVIFPL